jgi:hypothetical protein
MTAPDTSAKAYPGNLLMQSEQNCHAFVARLSAGERSNDVFFDITTTTLAALGTAFTPLGTVHALSAAATISAGTKTAIDSDLFAKQFAEVIADQIQTEYSQQVTTYLTQLSNQSGPVVPLEAAQIQEINGHC